MTKPLIEFAFDFINSKKEPVNFSEIWAYIVAQEKLSEEEANGKVAKFYTNLMLDGRFVTLGDNLWDLRSRHTFDKVHIDMRDVYSDVETSDDDEEESEEKEYNGVFDENKDDDGDEVEPEESEEETL